MRFVGTTHKNVSRFGGTRAYPTDTERRPSGEGIPSDNTLPAHSGPSSVGPYFDRDWGQLVEAERVHVWNSRISGTGRVDSVMPDGSAVWVWLENGMGRVLLIEGEDRLRRLDGDPGS
ncbi:hypothetical protein [Arthrobacter sp. S2(2024)]|uniref:hypothetical protein n=1 Tax=Arthrobacter sp. S2(2024) TaxID=3111911 RepID=UPI002FC7B4D7